MKMITYQHTGCNESSDAEGNLIVVNGNIKKDLKILLTLYLMKLGKEEQTKPKASRKKETKQIRVQINKVENGKTEKI